MILVIGQGLIGSTLLGRLPAAVYCRHADFFALRNLSDFSVIINCTYDRGGFSGEKEASDLFDIKILDHIPARSRYVYFSSRKVYSAGLNLSERDALSIDPLHSEKLTTYGLRKRLVEAAVRNRVENHLILRLPNLFGPIAGRSECFFGQLVNRARVEKCVTLNTSLFAFKDFFYEGDLAELVEAICLTDIRGTFNVAYESKIDLRTFIDRFIGSVFTIDYVRFSNTFDDQFTLDSGLLREAFPFSSKPDDIAIVEALRKELL